MQTQNQGAYRNQAKNPHKAAYDREESLRRLRKNAGWRIKGLKWEVDCLEEQLDDYSSELEKKDNALRLQRSYTWTGIGAAALFCLGLFVYHFASVGVLETRNAELQAAYDRLAIERAGLTMENDALMAENADLRAELVLAESRGFRCRMDGLMTRSQLRTCQRSVEDMRLTAARLDGRISTLEILCAHGSVQTVNADRIVVDEYGATCRENELLGPEGTCPNP